MRHRDFLGLLNFHERSLDEAILPDSVALGSLLRILPGVASAELLALNCYADAILRSHGLRRPVWLSVRVHQMLSCDIRIMVS